MDTTPEHDPEQESLWHHFWHFYRVTSIYLCFVLTVIAATMILDLVTR